MPKQPADIDALLRAALRRSGRLLPQTDEEMEEALQHVDSGTAPNLCNPYELYESNST